MEENTNVSAIAEPVVVAPNVQENMSSSENAPVSYYSNDTGNGAAAALLAGLATKDYYSPVDSISANGIGCIRAEVGDVKGLVKDVGANVRSEVKESECNIRHDVVKAESEIRRDVAKSECDIRHDVMSEGQEIVGAVKDSECRLSKDILETRHTLAKDILKSEYENKLAIQTAIKEINTESRHNAERLQDRLDKGFERQEDKTAAFKDFTAEKFCSVEKQLAHCCCEVQAAIAGLRTSTLTDQLTAAQSQVSQAGLISAIVNALNTNNSNGNGN